MEPKYAELCDPHLLKFARLTDAYSDSWLAYVFVRLEWSRKSKGGCATLKSFLITVLEGRD